MRGINELGLVELYGVKVRAVVTSPLVSVTAPVRVLNESTLVPVKYDPAGCLLLKVVQSVEESAPVADEEARASESAWPTRERPFAVPIVRSPELVPVEVPVKLPEESEPVVRKLLLPKLTAPVAPVYGT